MQNSNHAINVLKEYILNEVLPENWNGKSVDQFKYFIKELRYDGLLVRKINEQFSVVVSFPFMI